MKKLLISIMFTTLFFSCQAGDRGEAASDEDLRQMVERKASLNTIEGVVVLQDLTFYKDESLKSYYTPLSLNEQVVVLNDPDKPVIIKERKYLKIQSANNPDNIGFVNQYYIAVKGRLAVVNVEDAAISPNPDTMKLTEQTVPAFSIVAVYPDTLKNGLMAFDYIKDGYVYIQKRYMKESDLNFNDNDIKAAILYQFSLDAPSKKLKEQYLSSASQSSSLLSAPYIEAIKAINDIPPTLNPSLSGVINDNTTAKFYAEPNRNSLPLTMGFPKGKVNLISKSKTSDTIGGETNYWYLDSNYGWIFGSNLTINQPAATATTSLPLPSY